MRKTIASVSTYSRAQNNYKTKRRRKSRVRGKTAKRRLIFSKDMRVRARAGYVRGRHAGRAYLLSKQKKEMRKNEKSGKTRVASMRATGRVNVWATGRVRVRVARGRANGMIGQTIMRKRGRGNG